MGNGMSNFTDFISSGGGATLETVVLTKSQTWTPPVNGTGVIHVIGGGASGNSNGGNNGGGAGGYSRKAVTFATGTNWTITVGAGGGGGTNQNYAAAGSSTAADGSSSLTANGGTAGVTGGTASGGDVNFRGGGGGSISSGSVYGGGGAVGVFAEGLYGINYSGGQTTDASGGAESFVVLGLGQLIGGTGGASGVNGEKGGFLCGGGTGYSTDNNTLATGGKGGIGGGGGGAYHSNTGLRTSGDGGDGIVIVQYLTVS